MKKKVFFILVIAILVFIFALATRSHSSGDPSISMDNSYQRILDTANRFIDEYGDNGIVAEVELISNTLDENRRISAYVLYEYDEHLVTISIAEDRDIELVDGYNDYYKNLYTVLFFNNLSKSGLPKEGNVRGVILQWSQGGNWKTDCSLCDVDGDGQWDYFGSGKGQFCVSDDVSYPSATVGNSKICFGGCTDICKFEMGPNATIKDVEKIIL